ncbi:hypothetical protein APHAL10511_005168 [Amanita phalloides]|nr:hypothetical protein APHAL10511_005168 [Amanita phalloides]
MSGKTLSTSTLSLRFMQNAHRAKFLKEVELERAEVYDDAQWDVGQEVREAWGLHSEQDESQRITHETSFLPFLFSDATTDLDPTLKLPTGRRKFTNAVEEVEGPAEQQQEQEPEESPTRAPQKKEKPSRSRVHPNPIPIQAVSGKLIHGLPPLKSKPSKESKSARQAIFDNSGVGTDLRAAKRKMDKTDDVDDRAPIGFLKPSGVDAPPATSKSKNPDAIDGAREKKHKRTHETTEETDESVKKRKKKKQAT